MGKIVLEGCIVVPESEFEIVKNELKSHINLTKEEGCLEFRVDQDENDKHRFHVCEEVESQEAFQYHQERTLSSCWGRITKNVERHYQIYEKS